MKAPQKGEPITYRGELVGHVSRIEGNICHYLPIPENRTDSASCLFIWYFPRDNAVNSLHDWPSKGGK